MYPPNDHATCALIQVLWSYHCGQHGIVHPNAKRITRPDWMPNPILVAISKPASA